MNFELLDGSIMTNVDGESFDYVWALCLCIGTGMGIS